MEKKKRKFTAVGRLSWMLFQNLRSIYFNELQSCLKGNTSRHKLHGFTMQGISAFSLTGAIWEAIINEQFTSDIVSYVYKEHILYDIIEQAEKWDIKTKTLMFPKFLFGRTFDTSLSIYSDLTSIIQIRNCVTHYKHSLYEGPDKPIANLRNKKITYPKPQNVGCPWHMEISSTECIRFCLNTISDLAQILSDLETTFYKTSCLGLETVLFQKITDQHVLTEFKKYEVDPQSCIKDLISAIGGKDAI